ncbi:MAG: homocysteine S-methyltransferase family protein, partial [Ignavibacteriaceae bacterium]|nr:homocysteine S-methyltransferase family protein [Ignavibacteriaceae bacterium]
MNRLSELLGIKKLLVCDGAWGTMLQNKGLKPGECPELLNLTYPKLVKEIPEAYSKAGAELVKTNSFGGNKYRLSHYSLERKIFEINKTAAEISKDGVKDKALILGSIGPSGVILMMGDTSEEEMYETYSIQASALEAGGADALLIETFSDIQEAIIAIKAAKDNTNLEIISTFTFEKTIDGDFKTMMGYTPTQICVEVEKAGIGYIGTNCGNGFEAMAYIIKEFKEK